MMLVWERWPQEGYSRKWIMKVDMSGLCTTSALTEFIRSMMEEFLYTVMTTKLELGTHEHANGSGKEVLLLLKTNNAKLCPQALHEMETVIGLCQGEISRVAIIGPPVGELCFSQINFGLVEHKLFAMSTLAQDWLVNRNLLRLGVEKK